MEEEKLFYTLALQNVEGVGDMTFKKLLNYFEDAEAVLKASVSDWMQVEGIGDRLIANLQKDSIFFEAEREVKTVKNRNIHLAYYQDESYPSRLKQCDDGPVLLYAHKPIVCTAQRVISVVGTRNPTRRGIEFCRQLINDLAPYNPIVVSGFAFGVDITAHKIAVEKQLKTIAVLGHGLLDVYPNDHRRYVKLLESNGGFLTEFRTNNKIDRENFIKRNRIVAGISEATVVIESATKGGSMSTARFANDYNREVFAVPGRVDDKYSQGCNRLIQTNKAHLIKSAQDIVEMLQWDVVGKQKVVQRQLFVELTVEEQRVYDLLVNSGKQSMDFISMNCQIPIYKIGALLLNMELKGVVRPLPGKIFEVF